MSYGQAGADAVLWPARSSCPVVSAMIPGHVPGIREKEFPARLKRSGIVMSGWRPLIKGYFAVAR